MNLSTAYELKKQISVEMKKGFVFTMYIIVLLILFSSCQNKTKNHVIQLVSGHVEPLGRRRHRLAAQRHDLGPRQIRHDRIRVAGIIKEPVGT